MKKLISLALISAMLLTFTACDKKENSTNSSWTAETAASVFCIDGKPIPYPFTVDALGSDYSIKESDTEISDSGFCRTDLYHGKDKILVLTYDNINKFDDIPSATPKSILTYFVSMEKYEKAVQESISFNGISLGMSKNDVVSAFGEPNNDKSGPLWLYKDSKADGNCITFSFNSDEKVNYMRIFFIS